MISEPSVSVFPVCHVFVLYSDRDKQCHTGNPEIDLVVSSQKELF